MPIGAARLIGSPRGFVLPSLVPSRDPAVALHPRKRVFLSDARAHVRFRGITMRALAAHNSWRGAASPPERSPAVLRLSGYGDRVHDREELSCLPVMLSPSRSGGASASQRLGRTAT